MNLTGLVALIGTLIICLGFTPQQFDLSSPKATVQSLLNAFIKSDAKAFARCIDGLIPAKLPTNALPGSGGAIIAKDPRFLVEISGDEATVAVSYDIVPPKPVLQGTASFSYVDMFILKKEPGGWLIVPEKYPTTGEDPDFRLRPRPLQYFAATMLAYQTAQREAASGSGGAVPKDDGGRCLLNMFQIAQAAQFYASDNDGKLPPAASNLRKNLEIYLRSADQLRCPLDAKGTISYSMNVNVQKLSPAKIANPGKTVLFYEGKDGVLNFRHSGTAAVAFADGQASMVNMAQAKSLIWTPSPTTASKRSK